MLLVGGRAFAKNVSQSRTGSWRICEKDSAAHVSRHPGDRYWNDLLGQRAACPNHTVFAGRPADTANGAVANAFARDAAASATDTERRRTELAAAQFAGS